MYQGTSCTHINKKLLAPHFEKACKFRPSSQCFFPPQCHTQSNPHNHVLRARRAGETEVKSACSKVKGRISEVKPLLASSTLNKCENLQVQYVWRSWFWATGACVSFQNGSLTRVDAATVSFALCYPSCSPLRGWAEFAHTVASRLIITKAYFKH